MKMSGWGLDPNRKPMAHKDAAKKWKRRNAASVQATPSTDTPKESESK
jgi:hypothetical protein